jgi:hypothetical protein
MTHKISDTRRYPTKRLLVPKDIHRNLGTRAPKVTGEFLQGVPTGFASFIRDPVCAAFVDRLVGEDNDVALLVSDLRRGQVVNHTTRANFKRWVANVWLPTTVNPVKRGPAYWQRVASVVWEICEGLVDLRHRTKKAIQKEMERLARADRRARSKLLAARERRKARREHARTDY